MGQAPRQWCLVDPRSSQFMGYWDIIGLFALIFTALVTPFEISFLEPSVNASAPLFIINRIIDGIFLIDLVLQYFLVYEDESVADASERWVTDRGRIFWHYTTGWFSIDLVACAVSGFDFVGLGDVEMNEQDRMTFQVLRALRCIKLLRLLRLVRLFRRWERRLVFNYGTMALVRCVVYVLTTCHWCACVWTLQTLFVSDVMGTWRGEAGYCWRDERLPLSISPPIVCATPLSTWTASFYFIMMTITSVGYGEISATAGNSYEQMVCTVLILVTALMWSQVISIFCLVLANAHPATQEFHNSMDLLNDYMDTNAFPKSLRGRLRTYFHETRNLRIQRRHRALLNDMSPTLAARSMIEINGKSMSAIWFLDDCSREAIYRLGDAMSTRVYAPAERTEHDTLNIVQRGLVMYRCFLKRRHDAWGFDVALQKAAYVRSSEAKALTYLEVSCIRRVDLLQVLKDLVPSDAKSIRMRVARLALFRHMVTEAEKERNNTFLSALVAAQEAEARDSTFSYTPVRKALETKGTLSDRRKQAMVDDRFDEVGMRLDTMDEAQQRIEGLVLQMHQMMTRQTIALKESRDLLQA